ncbi:MAG: winged helix-turn-helix domain-containing protein [Candidatus Eremiobacteraeota bacterium]|nr:winged helix-turn-helix domain-containing protein [Candidatus Eremiobacteraeota bacterium]
MLGSGWGIFEHLAMSRVPVGRLRFDLDSRVLYDGSEIAPLAPLPAQMLAELVRANGDVVSTAWMRQLLWGEAAVEERNLNQQMYNLRRALRRDPSIAIQNVPRRGYRLVVTSGSVSGLRKSTRIVWAGMAAALGVLLMQVPQPQSAAPSDTSDLAIGNYLSTSEGPDHLDRAAHYYHALVAEAPDVGAGYGGLAVIDARRALSVACHDARSRYFDVARMEAAAALRHDTSESNALTALGIVSSVYDHHLDVARKLFDAAVAADPRAESPRAWRAKFLLSIGEFDEAGREFQTMSQNAPTSGYAVGLFGEWLVLDRDYKRAGSVLAQALDLGNHPGLAKYWLARSYYFRGFDRQALRLTNEVLALYPGEASAIALRARIEARRGNIRAAHADFKRLQRIHDPNEMDPIALASASIALGNRTEASRILHQYLSSGNAGLDEIARIRTDPDFDSLRSGFNASVSL